MKLDSNCKYYLYLDESGDFDEDKSDLHSDPSLVGGVLCTKELDNEIKADGILTSVWQSFVTKYPRHAGENYQHATEINNGQEKAELKVMMVEEIVKQGYIPVVFQQDDKYVLQTNTTTYMMYLVDGLIKFIEDTGVQYLSVIVGGRKDMDKVREYEAAHPGRRGKIRLLSHPEPAAQAKGRELLQQSRYAFLAYLKEADRPLGHPDYIAAALFGSSSMLADGKGDTDWGWQISDEAIESASASKSATFRGIALVLAAKQLCYGSESLAPAKARKRFNALQEKLEDYVRDPYIGSMGQRFKEYCQPVLDIANRLAPADETKKGKWHMTDEERKTMVAFSRELLF